MFNDEITSIVRQAWRELAEIDEYTPEIGKGNFPELNSILTRLQEEFGFEHIHDLTRHVYGSEAISGMPLWGAITELERNARVHGQAKLISDVGGVYKPQIFYHTMFYTSVRYVSDKSGKYFEVYVFDRGKGFPNINGIPQIEEAIKPKVSLSDSGEGGVGLTNAIKGADNWEIECRGYALRKGKALERLPTEPINGVMVHLAKYV